MMNNKKTVIVLLVAFLVTLAVFFSAIILVSGPGKTEAFFSVFDFPEEFTDKKPFSEYNYNKLNETEKKAYICILNNIGNHPEYIKIPELTKEEFNNVYFAVKNDNPDMLCFSDSCNMISNSFVSLVELNYDYTPDVCNEMNNRMNAEIERIFENAPVFTDAFSKELFVHDYIVSNCVYGESENSSTAYGCIVENKAVCSGYSRAAMLLLGRIGVDSVLIGGTGISSSQGEISHMWNVVWLDGSPYYLDVTWDDLGDEGISHLYFNLTDDDLSADHTDYSFTDECKTNEYNYFRYSGLYFESYGKEQLDIIRTELLENIENGINFLEIKFESEEDFMHMQNEFIGGITPGSDIYYIVEYISTEAEDKIDVSHINFSSDENKKYIRLMFDWN